MIIIGYQGIGKSTLARNQLSEHGMSEYIDLESSCFWHDGKRPDDWYIYYCQMAEFLSRQGFKVFVSSHKIVRDFLRNSKEQVLIICPNITLKKEWIKRLENRYNDNPSEKNYKAWKNAAECFEQNISDLLSERKNQYKVMTIESMKYYLESIIDTMEVEWLLQKMNGGEEE